MQKIINLVRKLKDIFLTTFLTSYYCIFFYASKLREKSVLFESRNGLDVAGNIFRLIEEMKTGKYGNRRIYLSLCPETMHRARAMMKRYSIRGVCFVRQGSLRYYRLLAQVKYIFTDTSLPRMYIKKDGQIYTNTWHGTPLKHMGKYNLSERHSMGNIQRNLLFSDYLLFSNVYMKEKMLESYNINTSFQGEILYGGFPRNTVFFDEENAHRKRNQLGFENEKVYVYMPTWKAENMGDTMQASLNAMRESLKKIDDLLNDNQIILLKLHPLVRAHADTEGFKHIKPFPEDFEAYEVLSACDGLITDYSSVFFDFACSKKSIVLFTPDEGDYDSRRGFYFPLDDLPFPKAKTEQELCVLLDGEIRYDAEKFCERFCTFDSVDSTERILSHIFLKKDCLKTERIEKSSKKRVLFCCGGLLENGLTASFKNLVGMIDLNEREYFFTFKQSAFNNHPERLNAVPKKMKLYGIGGKFNYTFIEALAFVIYYKLNRENTFVRKMLERAYKRDFKKNFTSLEMDYVVNFSGYDKYVIELLRHYDARRIIFVHSDMEQEIKNRSNQHRLTLEKAYRDYDKVAVVISAMKEPTARISGRKDNITVVGNRINNKQIVNKSELPIKFQFATTNLIRHPGGIEGILNESGRKFVTVGRFSVEKQHTMLIDAFGLYHSEHPDSWLVIIGGPGNMYLKTLAYINMQPFRSHIAVIRSIENPMPIIKKCDLFLLTSKYEAQPIVLFEADALSVPAACTYIKGPAELLGQYGGTVVENSIDGILGAMKMFDEGKITTMNIDFDAYNKTATEQFEKLFV